MIYYQYQKNTSRIYITTETIGVTATESELLQICHPIAVTFDYGSFEATKNNNLILSD
ncbi:hypothetical protein [Scytonema sp. NUACC21]